MCQLCDAADVVLLQLSWGGKTAAFGMDNEPINLLAHYLSKQWFQCTHIHQQLELLRLDLKCAGILHCELLSLYTFEILQQMYQACKSISYGKDKAQRDIWALGKEIASGHQTIIASITNVNGNHWVGILIDVVNLTVKYGDSFGGAEASEEAVEAVTWWIQSHISAIFKHNILPITCQINGFSCGILSIDTIRHAVLPGSLLIQAASPLAIDQVQMEMFVQVAQLDAQYVHCCLFSGTNF